MDIVARAIAARAQPLRPSYTGQVATRAFAPTAVQATYRSLNSTTYHVAQDDIAALQVEYANWYCDLAAPYEKLPGATPTYTAYIQYPIGSTWQRFRWGGANSYTFADGETKLSDLLTLATTIPRGAMFLLAVHCDTPNGLAVYNFANSSYTAANNKQAIVFQQFDVTTTPAGRADIFDGTSTLVTSGNSVQSAIFPTAIVASTRRPSVLFVGNSRDYGSGNYNAATEVDGSGNTGGCAGPLGRHFGYINVATSGDKLQNLLTATTRRMAQAKYVTHVVGWDLINDVNGGRTPAQMKTDLVSFMALPAMAGKSFFAVTAYPSTTSSDAWVTTANQTPTANNANRIALNGMIRAGQIPGLAGFFDVAAALESDLNSGLFGVDQGLSLTADGLHCNYRGYQRIMRSGVVDPARIV